MHIDWTTAGRDALDVALAHAPLHLSYPLRAVRDEGCAYLFVAQGLGRFQVPTGKPAILLIGDDLATALGPKGFHARSLRRAISRMTAVAIVASEPIATVYSEAASWAAMRRENAAIIETRPEREAEWVDFVREVAPAGVALALATVLPEGLPC